MSIIDHTLYTYVNVENIDFNPLAKDSLNMYYKIMELSKHLPVAAIHVLVAVSHMGVAVKVTQSGVAKHCTQTFGLTPVLHTLLVASLAHSVLDVHLSMKKKDKEMKIDN